MNTEIDTVIFGCFNDCVYRINNNQCEKHTQYSTRRSEIYNRANQAAEDAHAKYGTSPVEMRVNKRRAAFNAIASEHIDQPCPFYETKAAHCNTF